MATLTLGLPTITQSQEDKYLTHNEALFIVDAFTKVLSRSNSGPPVSPAATEGDSYIVDTATGAWATGVGGGVDKVAVYFNGGWVFKDPVDGPLVRVTDEDTWVGYSGSEWVAAAAGLGIVSLATTAHTLALTNASKRLRCEATGGTTITIPPEVSVAFDIGTLITIRRVGGATTVTAATGVTLLGTGVVPAVNASLSLTKVGSDVWESDV